MKGIIVSVNVSDTKGVRKTPVQEIVLREDYGLDGDAHASSEWHRQVSLLALESIRKMQAAGLDVSPGDFAENITTEGVDLMHLPVGERISLGDDVELEITQIGKVCHERCAIYYQAGDCVMPKEGVFARVVKGGVVRKGDPITVAG
jgi:MOSC domain-containing protein YiiM